MSLPCHEERKSTNRFKWDFLWGDMKHDAQSRVGYIRVFYRFAIFFWLQQLSHFRMHLWDKLYVNDFFDSQHQLYLWSQKRNSKHSGAGLNLLPKTPSFLRSCLAEVFQEWAEYYTLWIQQKQCGTGWKTQRLCRHFVINLVWWTSFFYNHNCKEEEREKRKKKKWLLLMLKQLTLTFFIFSKDMI